MRTTAQATASTELGRKPLYAPAWQLDPLSKVRQQPGCLLLKAFHAQWGAVGLQHLSDVEDKALRHRDRVIPDIDGKQQLALRVDRHPHLVRRTLKARNGLSLTSLTNLDSTEKGEQFVELDLGDVDILEQITRSGAITGLTQRFMDEPEKELRDMRAFLGGWGGCRLDRVYRRLKPVATLNIGV